MNYSSPSRLTLFLLVPALLGIATCSTLAQAQSQSTNQAMHSPTKPADACPSVQVQGLKPGQGFLMLAAYDSAATYFKTSVWQIRVPVTDAQMMVSVCELANQEIAFTGFQDLNGNGKLDSNPLGIPSEPFGASGSPPAFSAPTWDATKVKVVADSIVTVKM